MSSRPVIRLRPKTDPRRIRRGFPWVYDNELVVDRRTKALEPGSIATLEDADRQPLATVAVNPNSKIMGRVLDLDPEAEVGHDWLAGRLRAALDLRDMLYDAPFYRLVHAEADGFPGTVIDRFGEACVIQPNSAWIEARFDDLADVLSEVSGVTTIFKNAGGRARGLEGLDDASLVARGALSGAVRVPMNGATYLADLEGGQKTGLFYDQRPNHAFVQRLARGTEVLDVFSHVGGFALAALVGGATRALAVDGSAPALALAAQGAEATGVADRFETRQADAFDALTALAEEGRTFGTVVCDPPAFAPSKNALDAGLRAYERVARLAAPLVAPGGTVTLCSCSHAVDLDAFRTACLRGIGRAGRKVQILRTGFAGPDHPLHPSLTESGYLKAMTFRLLP
ncbi:class I SAM-dependent rRNA methyltransferase [Silicimonas algicola]|uniref:SAM-dependent methyltransferase n=1 Tax=Silicimonas algicola TaxID=1826607 RepID=A0A316GCI0_9RHOB|nr:class I SAM-dependent rRNA methyltransferase [Silicimonas algicola]AZQ67874.1 class I SAM-dependent rRNA methyltransferase [Silicimonas algicola]PWK57696.1 SAM-dependent methyltransferase [Silicimonas algicola]